MAKKGPIVALAWYVASPQGRRRIAELRQRYDTPANRRRAQDMAEKVLAKRRKR